MCGLLARVAHKHASLGITPDQYQVVHDYLMWAIAEVLGDAVTPEVAAAWDEVYWLMAYTLIHVERGLYSARGVRPQTVWRRWEVEQKIRETDDVVTFVVKRVDDRLVKSSLPGQYVTVQVPLPDGTRQPRQYSLSRADDGECRQFTVKRVHGAGKPDGQVSTLLHTQVDVGDVLTMSVPFGAVVLDDAAGRPMVFASAGIGSTSMAGMLSHLAKAGSHLPIVLLHADHDEDSFALCSQILADIAALPGSRIHLWYGRGGNSRLPVTGVLPGEMDISQVSLPDDATYHLCGPIPFMHEVRNALIKDGIPPQDIQYEAFGPDLWQADYECSPTFRRHR
ncbi:FAD-binding oxidoreductase [Streptomyces sp. NPDC008222]|uniref:FAD-binding oxidoreductase n=1 Tax=Streptomyces sp. NPDC008222 TaxID=3364820 RepID=UPI0036E8F339